MKSGRSGADAPSGCQPAASAASSMAVPDEPTEVMDAIAQMMSEFVDNWPQPKRVETALALVAKTIRTLLDPPDDQIKQMVDRFLGWRLPESFSPDAGISFEPVFNKGSQYEGRHQPIGTNLFSASEAEAMVRHMLSTAGERE